MNTQYELASELKSWIKTYSQTDATHNGMCKIKDVEISYAIDIGRLSHGSPIATIFIDAESSGQTKPSRKPYKYDYVIAFHFLMAGGPANTIHQLCDCVDRFRDYIIANPQMYNKSVADGGVAAKNIYLTMWTAISPIGTKTREQTSVDYVYRTMNLSLYELGV